MKLRVFENEPFKQDILVKTVKYNLLNRIKPTPDQVLLKHVSGASFQCERRFRPKKVLRVLTLKLALKLRSHW